MYLINVRTYKLEEFIDETVVQYAILSHRWGAEEVSFRDMQSSEAPSSKKGFRKIEFSCIQALEDGWHYVWVDTCCINKESTAELTEAINSMYHWYQSSEVCYAFLEDLSLSLDNTEEIGSQIEHCEWFERGWALQELIAPRKMSFYDRSWKHVGTKHSLCRVLYERTGIPEGVLLDSGSNLSRYSIAQRMSWASGRITTRPEDMAYCLLGIFDVNMPMLYGEGKRAFLRLQEEVIKQVDDHSIFAWSFKQDYVNLGRVSGLLADSPLAFEDCGNVVAKPWANNKSFGMTNRGLNILLRAIPCTTDMYIACLNAVRLHNSAHGHLSTRIGIFLQRQEDLDQYVRVFCGGLSEVALPDSLPDKSVLRGLRGTDFWLVPFHVRQRGLPNEKRKCANGFRITLIDKRSEKGGSATKLIRFKPPHEGPTTGTICVGTGLHRFRRVRVEIDAELNAVLFIDFCKIGNPFWLIKDVLKIGDPGAGWTHGKSPELTCTWEKIAKPRDAIELMQGKSGCWAIKSPNGGELRFTLDCMTEFRLHRTSMNKGGGEIWALEIHFLHVKEGYDSKESFLSNLVPVEDVQGFAYTPPPCAARKPHKKPATTKPREKKDEEWETSGDESRDENLEDPQT